MDAELKAKWVKALRSGRYKQAVSALRDCDGKYCCLGVLATVQRAKWVPADGGFYPKIKGRSATFDNDTTSLLLGEFAGGLTCDRQNELANLNDERKSFSEIAEYIEREL